MNATPPVSRTPSTPASVNSAKPGGPAPDFAAALTGAAAKPARRAGGQKTAGAAAIGGHLPADGNVPPPAAPLPSVSSAAASAAAFAAGTVGNTSKAGVAVDSGAGAISGAAISRAAAKIPDQTSGSTALGPVAAAPTSTDDGPTGFALAVGLSLVDPGADGTPIPGNAAAPTIAAITATTTATTAAPAGPPASPRVAAAALKHIAGTAAAAAASAAFKAATSGSSSNDGVTSPAPNAGAVTADGTAAPAADANSTATAAMSAAATGLVVATGAKFAGAADSPSATADGMDSPGAKTAQGTRVPTGPPALAATRSAAALAAHANAQAVSTVADAGTSDRHAAGEAGPAPLSGIAGDAAAGAAQSTVNLSGVADSAPTPTLRVPAGMDTPEFGQGIADRVSWMVDNNLNGAKLQVNPPQLGPIEVRIAVQGGHAQVWFTSHSAVTRDALESSSPKLREMLGAQGFGQVSVDISQGSFQERPAYSQPYEWTPSANRGSSTAPVQSTAISAPRASSGALDAYA